MDSTKRHSPTHQFWYKGFDRKEMTYDLGCQYRWWMSMTNDIASYIEVDWGHKVWISRIGLKPRQILRWGKKLFFSFQLSIWKLDSSVLLGLARDTLELIVDTLVDRVANHIWRRESSTLVLPPIGPGYDWCCPSRSLQVLRESVDWRR